MDVKALLENMQELNDEIKNLYYRVRALERKIDPPEKAIDYGKDYTVNWKNSNFLYREREPHESNSR